MEQKWEPFVEANEVRTNPVMESLRQQVMEDAPFRIFINNIYQVAVYKPQQVAENLPAVIHLSIKRRDKQHVRDWRHMQRIKNELVGPEHEGCELYPAESRLVDTSNQYHIFVFANPELRLPFGFGERWVNEESNHGTYQRPFPADAKPKDLKTTAQYCAERGLKIP